MHKLQFGGKGTKKPPEKIEEIKAKWDQAAAQKA